jgi:Flp pilus assembly protein TadB
MTERGGLVLAVIGLTLVGARQLRPHLVPSRSATDGLGRALPSSSGRERSDHRLDRNPAATVAEWVRWLADRRPQRRTALRPEDVARWCDDLARRVRTGSSLTGALLDCTNVEALHDATAPIRHALERGTAIADCLTPPTRAGLHPAVIHRGPPGDAKPGHQHLALALSVIAAVAEVGGSAAPALDRVASALRLRAVDRDDRATQAAQARLSAHVLTVLPVLMLSVLVVTDADVRDVITGGVGAMCVLMGTTLNLAGWCWMRRVIGRPR